MAKAHHTKPMSQTEIIVTATVTAVVFILMLIGLCCWINKCYRKTAIDSADVSRRKPAVKKLQMDEGTQKENSKTYNLI